MRPSPLHDRLHAAVIALALCSTSVSIVVAGQPQDAQSADATAGAAGVDADRQGGESMSAIRSFADMIAEAARERQRLSAATPPEACSDAGETAVSAEVSGKTQEPPPTAPQGEEGLPADACGDAGLAAAL